MSLVPAALLCAALLSTPQGQPPDQRSEAERLAQSGQYARALKEFQAMAAANPDDIEARTWIARLHVLMGHPERAVAVYESIVAAAPQNVPAIVGLGETLVSVGRLAEAGDALNRAESLAPDSPAVLAAQGSLHRAAGHGTLAVAYYQRALALEPGNAATRAQYDALRAARAHRIEATYYNEQFDNDRFSTEAPDTNAGFLEVNARVSDSVRLFAQGQHQRKFDDDDTRGGGGFEWMPTANIRVRIGGIFGSDTLWLPDAESTLDASYQRNKIGLLGTIRYLHFEGASSVILSPGVTYSPNDRLIFALRYYRSQLDVAGAIGGGESNDGVTAGAAGRIARRVWLGAKYGRGYESHPVITLERLLEFDVDTFSGNVRIEAAPMTSLAATYQYERRAAGTRVGVLFVNLTQRF